MLLLLLLPVALPNQPTRAHNLWGSYRLGPPYLLPAPNLLTSPWGPQSPPRSPTLHLLTWQATLPPTPLMRQRLQYPGLHLQCRAPKRLKGAGVRLLAWKAATWSRAPLPAPRHSRRK